MIPEYLTIKQVGALIGKPWNSLRRWESEGKMPPEYRSTKPHKWKRFDIEAWIELEELGLFGDWLPLRARLGPKNAWAVMLARLEAENARTAAVVAREVKS